MSQTKTVTKADIDKLLEVLKGMSYEALDQGHKPTSALSLVRAAAKFLELEQSVVFQAIAAEILKALGDESDSSGKPSTEASTGDASNVRPIRKPSTH